MRTTLVQITDTHIHDQPDTDFKGTRPDLYLQRLLRHVLYHLGQPDALILTGDLTHDGGAAACRHLAECLQVIDCPIYITPGNHDDDATLREHLLDERISMPEQIELRDWRLLFADSHITGQTHGEISPRDLQRIEQQLTDGKPGLLFTHHPPLSIQSHWMDEIGMRNGKPVVERLRHYANLQAILFGHIHQHWDDRVDHLQLLGCPSSCVQFTPLSDAFGIDDRDPGYRVIRLEDEKLLTWVMRCSMKLTRIISGGQTGVDRAALDAALDWAIPHGGWCPRGRQALDGPIDAKYQLIETPSAGYAQRTEWNVRDADATLILSWGPVDGGSALTARLARQMNKSLLIVDLRQAPPVADVWRWLNREAVAILNIAGPRHSKNDKVYGVAREYMDALLGWHGDAQQAMPSPKKPQAES
jgi:Icc protein